MKSEKEWLRAVSKDGNLLREVEQQTPEIVLAAVKQSGLDVLRYLDTQDINLCFSVYTSLHGAGMAPVTLTAYHQLTPAELLLNPENPPLVQFNITESDLAKLVPMPVDEFLSTATWDDYTAVFNEADALHLAKKKTILPNPELDILRHAAFLTELSNAKHGTLGGASCFAQLRECDTAVAAIRRHDTAALRKLLKCTCCEEVHASIREFLKSHHRYHAVARTSRVELCDADGTQSQAPIGSKHISEVKKGDVLWVNGDTVTAASDAYMAKTDSGKEWNFETEDDEYVYASDVEGFVSVIKNAEEPLSP